MFPHSRGCRILPVHSEAEAVGKARKLPQQQTEAMKDIASILFWKRKLSYDTQKIDHITFYRGTQGLIWGGEKFTSVPNPSNLINSK